jgi:hypothetical protein
MAEIFECEFCFSSFTSKGNLLTHQKRTKKCLILQNKDITDDFVCNVCNKKYTSKYRMTKHLEKCKENNERKYSEIELKYNNLVKTSTITIDALKKKLKEHEKILKEKNEQIKELQDKLSTIAEIGVKKETMTYKVNNNIINQLIPYDLDKHKISTIVNNEFTENHLYGKESGLANFAVKNLLQDSEGNYKMTCTDTARRIFLYKDKDGNVYKDVNANQFLDMYIPAVTKKSYNIISSKDTDEMLELSGYISGIEPAVVVTKLVGKLTPKPT